MRQQKSQGFSLIELLIAMGLMSMVAVGGLRLEHGLVKHMRELYQKNFQIEQRKNLQELDTQPTSVFGF